MLTDSMLALNIGQSFSLYCQNFCNDCNRKDRLHKLLATFQIGNLEGYVLLTEYNKSTIPQKYCNYDAAMLLSLDPHSNTSWGPLYLVKNVLLFYFHGYVETFC